MIPVSWGLLVQAEGSRSFSIGGDFVPQGIFGNMWGQFWLSQFTEWVTTNISWVVTRDAAKHPTQQNNLTQHVSSAEIEKSYPVVNKHFLNDQTHTLAVHLSDAWIAAECKMGCALKHSQIPKAS